jgi:hypothetical protein
MRGDAPLSSRRAWNKSILGLLSPKTSLHIGWATFTAFRGEKTLWAYKVSMHRNNRIMTTVVTK